MKIFQHVVTALATPFDNSGNIDFVAMKEILKKQVDAKVGGILVCGSTGEAATLSYEEKIKILDFVITEIDNKLPIMFGVGGNNTYEVVETCRMINDKNIQGILSVTPYYNKPSQEGLYAHFSLIAENTPHDVYLYNVPSRTGISIDVETVTKLSKIKNIVGLKDSVTDLSRSYKLRNQIGEHFTLLSGEDDTALCYRAACGDGVISVAANVIPQELQKIQMMYSEGKVDEAAIMHSKIIHICDAMFCGGNPSSVKYALYKMGLCDNTLRLPLVSISKENEEIIDKALKDYI